MKKFCITSQRFPTFCSRVPTPLKKAFVKEIVAMPLLSEMTAPPRAKSAAHRKSKMAQMFDFMVGKIITVRVTQCKAVAARKEHFAHLRLIKRQPSGMKQTTDGQREAARNFEIELSDSATDKNFVPVVMLR